MEFWRATSRQHEDISARADGNTTDINFDDRHSPSNKIQTQVLHDVILNVIESYRHYDYTYAKKYKKSRYIYWNVGPLCTVTDEVTLQIRSADVSDIIKSSYKEFVFYSTTFFIGRHYVLKLAKPHFPSQK